MITSKKTVITLLFVVLMLGASCTKANSLNTMMQKFTSVFVAQKKPAAKTIMPEQYNYSASMNTIMLAQAKPETPVTDEGADIVNDSIMEASFTVETYAYKSRNRRDPFISVLELQRSDLNDFQVEGSSYYGMIAGKTGKMALLKDATNMGFVFLEGQKIKNGVLLKVEQDSVIFKMEEFGTIQTRVIRLNKNLGKKK